MTTLVFDLGNVIYPAQFDRAFRAWSKGNPQDYDRIRASFAFDEAYALHERGKLSLEDYQAHVCGRWRIELTSDQFIEGWNSIFLEEFPGIRDLLGDLGKRHRIVAFSNTNPTHARFMRQKYRDVLGLFDQIVFSCEVGYRKPDKASFLSLLDTLGIRASEAAFFDDLEENVEGARSAGIESFLVAGFESLQQGLTSSRVFRETLVRSYFQSWIDRTPSVIRDHFADRVEYTECHGPRYENRRQVLRWFEDWNRKGQVLSWTIHDLKTVGDTCFVQWFFECDFEGQRGSFDGVSILRFDTQGKIASVREFQSKADHTLPYHGIDSD